MASVSLTDYASQQAEVERRRKMAELLQQQAYAPTEIQSYRGTQAPIPWTATLAKVLGAYGAARLNRKADAQERDARANARDEASRFLSGLQVDPGMVSGEDALAGLKVDRPGLINRLGGSVSRQQPQPSAAPMAAAAPAPIVGGASPAPAMGAALAGQPPQAMPQPVETMALAPQQPLMNTARARPMDEQQQMLMGASMSGNPYLEKLAPALYQRNVDRADKNEDRSFSLATAIAERQAKFQDQLMFARMKPEERTAMQKDYEFARQNGFKGDFMSFMNEYKPQFVSPNAGQAVYNARDLAAGGQSRGVRNNNPLNITVLPEGAWDGQTGVDGKFAVFATPEAGMAAADRNLQSYAAKGINTLEGVINRWAPTSENDTASYVAQVSRNLGVDPKAPLNLQDPALRSRVLQSMSKVELGGSGGPPQPVAMGQPKPAGRMATAADKQSLGLPADAQYWLEADGKPVPLAGEKPNKPLTEFQGKAVEYLSAALGANENMNELAQRGLFGPKTATDSLFTKDRDGTVRLVLRSDEDRQFMQAAKEWLAPILRKDTGAAVTDSELAYYMDIYIPKYEDSAQVKWQKAQARDRKMSSIYGANRSAYDATFGAPGKWKVLTVPQPGAARQPGRPSAPNTPPAPAGVDPKLWGALSPEERALWH